MSFICCTYNDKLPVNKIEIIIKEKYIKDNAYYDCVYVYKGDSIDK